jgi:hypothetical protein
MERMNAEQWDGVKLDVLAQAYMEVRREMWSLLAARVGEKWQLVETKVSLCYVVRYQLTNSTPVHGERL